MAELLGWWCPAAVLLRGRADRDRREDPASARGDPRLKAADAPKLRVVEDELIALQERRWDGGDQ